MNKKSILIVDDHPMIRSLMASLIKGEEIFELCGEASGVSDALKIAEECQPDVAIVDISLDDGNGIDLLKKLLRRQPGMKILVCSTHDDLVFAPRVLDAGAHGYISKRAEHNQILEALMQVAEGNTWLSPEVQSRLDVAQDGSQFKGIASLSNRELEVLRLVSKGLTPAKIAEQLHLSVKTIDAHREKIKRKLGMGSAAELLRYAVQWSLEKS